METKPFNPQLQERLNRYMEARDKTQTQVARELGVSTAVVNQYLKGRYNGDVPKLEGVIEDYLKNAERQEREDETFFENSVSRQINSRLEVIRSTRDVGLLHSPAGIGKTSGIRLYCAKNRTAISITATSWASDPEAIAKLIFDELDTRSWNGQVRKAEFVAKRLKGTNRLIIVDDAHKLRDSGLAYLFDLHDYADKLPVAMIGNPGVLDKVAKNDQMHSRIGLMRDVKIREDLATFVEQMVRAICELDVVPEELLSLALKVAENSGHFRALNKQLRLARSIREQSQNRKHWETCFRAAHEELVRNYKLEA